MSKEIHTLCVDARLLTSPGIGTYLNNILSHLKEAPLKWFALIHPEQRERLSAWPHIEPIFMGSSIYSIKEQLELSLKIPQVDLFWSPHYNVPCLPIRARKRLVTIHDTFHLAFASMFKPLERIYAQLMMQAAVRFADQIITASVFSKTEIEKYTGADNRAISVILHGVDEQLFCPNDENQDLLRVKYGITKPFILYVGSLKVHKNVKGVVEAFSLLTTQWKIDMDLVIVGSGEGMRHCEDVKQLCIVHPELKGKLHFIGHVSHDFLPYFYRRAHLFVFPSFYEGFGFPPLEAMRSGCPAVVGNVGAMPEVCGQGALYVDPHNTQEIAARLAELATDDVKRQELARKALERSQHFCWKRCAKEHLAVIEKVLA